MLNMVPVNGLKNLLDGTIDGFGEKAIKKEGTLGFVQISEKGNQR